MKKILILTMLLFLTACGADTTQQLKGEYRIEYNTQIANTKNVKATLKSIENKFDEVMGEFKEITFVVENRRDHAIEVQAHNIYLDGKRINQGSGIMSHEVKPGKKEKCVLTIQSYASSKLASVEKKIELDLHIFSWSHDEFSEDFDVEIKL